MLTKKEIFVLMGSGHKGSVKITPADSAKNQVEIECNLDFRPSGATLYIIGDEIAKLELNNSKTTDKVRFMSNSVQGCVIRSSSLTMFGGRGNKSEMLAKIDEGKRQKAKFRTRKTSLISSKNRRIKASQTNLKSMKITKNTLELKALRNSFPRHRTTAEF